MSDNFSLENANILLDKTVGQILDLEQRIYGRAVVLRIYGYKVDEDEKFRYLNNRRKELCNKLFFYTNFIGEFYSED